MTLDGPKEIGYFFPGRKQGPIPVQAEHSANGVEGITGNL
jgi:hypothetical protein